jgi:hypothetical protein
VFKGIPYQEWIDRMSSILFLIPTNPIIGGIGDLCGLFIAYKCKAKELGCDEIYVSEYPMYATHRIIDNNMTRSYYRMKEKDFRYLGIKRFPMSEDTSNFNYIIPPYLSEYLNGAERMPITTTGFLKYIDYYIRKYGDIEFYKPEKRNVSKPYIVLQYRNVTNKKTIGWNMDRNYFLSMYNNLRDLLGSRYEFWKIGEDFVKADEDLESLFDKIVPMDYDLDNVFPIIRNSSLTISQHSGIMLAAFLFGVPTMEIYIKEEVHPHFNKTYWKTHDNSENDAFLGTYNAKRYGGEFSSKMPPPSKLFLEEFLTKNELL